MQNETKQNRKRFRAVNLLSLYYIICHNSVNQRLKLQNKFKFLSQKKQITISFFNYITFFFFFKHFRMSSINKFVLTVFVFTFPWSLVLYYRPKKTSQKPYRRDSNTSSKLCIKNYSNSE